MSKSYCSVQKNGTASRRLLAQDVAGSGLSLALGYDKMLDADALAGEPVRPTGDVASSDNPRRAGLKVLVNDDAAICGKASALGQLGLRPHPDAHDHEICLESFSIRQRDDACVD
jgi:hypothetical protein